MQSVFRIVDRDRSPPRSPLRPVTRPNRRRLPFLSAQARTAGSRHPGSAARGHSPDRGDRADLVRRGDGCPASRHRRDRRASSRARSACRRAARDRRCRYRHGRGGKRVLRLSRVAFGKRPGALVRGCAHPRCRHVASAGVAAVRARPRAAGRRPDPERCRDAVGDGRRASLRCARRGGRRARRGLADREPAAPARRRGERGDRADAAPSRRRARAERRDDPLARRRGRTRRRWNRFLAARLADRDVSLPRRVARHLGCGMAR